MLCYIIEEDLHRLTKEMSERQSRVRLNRLLIEYWPVVNDDRLGRSIHYININ